MHRLLLLVICIFVFCNLLFHKFSFIIIKNEKQFIMNNQSKLMCASKRFCPHLEDRMILFENRNFYCSTCNFNIHGPECAHPLSIKEGETNQKVFQCMTCHPKMLKLSIMNCCLMRGCKELDLGISTT